MKKLFIISILSISSFLLNAQQRNFILSQFTFEDTTGKKFNLDSLKGKIVLIDCWFPACPPCREEMPYSKLLQQRLKKMTIDSHFVFVTISFKQTTEDWKRALHSLSMPDAIHLYSPASTYEITLSRGN